MSTNSRDRRKITTSLLLVLMFLFADFALQAVPNWTNDELDDTVIIMQLHHHSMSARMQECNHPSKFELRK